VALLGELQKANATIQEMREKLATDEQGGELVHSLKGGGGEFGAALKGMAQDKMGSTQVG
jgi:hypothetical protein